MKADDEIVQTSHGPATVKYVREHDIPFWAAAAAHAYTMAEWYRQLIEISTLKPSVDLVVNALLRITTESVNAAGDHVCPACFRHPDQHRSDCYAAEALRAWGG